MPASAVWSNQTSLRPGRLMPQQTADNTMACQECLSKLTLALQCLMHMPSVSARLPDLCGTLHDTADELDMGHVLKALYCYAALLWEKGNEAFGQAFPGNCGTVQ